MPQPAPEDNVQGLPHAAFRRVSIIVPAYNEENGLEAVLHQLGDIRTHLTSSGWETELIIVDDGSVDKTAEIASRHSDIVLLRHRLNRGYGAALKTGIRHASGDLICITDADGTYPNDRIPDLADRVMVYGYDMVVGSRTGERVAIPLTRRPAKWAIRRLASFVAGEPIPDLNSGLRVFPRADGAAFLRDFAGWVFVYDDDHLGHADKWVLGELCAHQLSCACWPLRKIRPIHDTLNFVQLVVRIALYFKPLKVFVPFSGLLFILALLWAGFSKLVLGQLADITTLVIAMTAIQVFMLGMLAELINHRLPNVYDKD